MKKHKHGISFELLTMKLPAMNVEILQNLMRCLLKQVTFEYRTKKATTPLTFFSIEEAESWKAEIAQHHPEFAKTIQLWKVTTIIESEPVYDAKQNGTSDSLGGTLLEEPTDS
jgi:hypothetical protein